MSLEYVEADEVIGFLMIALVVVTVIVPTIFLAVIYVRELIYDLWFHRICEHFNIDARSRLFRATKAISDVAEWCTDIPMDWHDACMDCCWYCVSAPYRGIRGVFGHVWKRLS